MAKKRMLIVDDEALSRALLRDCLQAAGYEPLEARDGTEGLAKAASLPPDVILLDVLMPGLDGFEVCQGLKANPATTPIPVIFVTMVQDATLNRRAYQAGGAACILKPVRREALLALLAAVLATAKGQAKSKPKHGGDSP